jgi:tRNA (mo5U34)-methyltransferase
VNHAALLARLQREGLGPWAQRLEAESADWLVSHGDYPRWSAALASLPVLTDIASRFDTAAVTIDAQCADSEALRQALQGLMPWRKGPYSIADVFIDCEWRSDFKWNRVLPQLAQLQGRRILDVGCGNGYHCWRMLAQSPELVLGIEPSVLFNLQFQALQHYLQREDFDMLPIGIEDMPENLNWFDTVFSMGVLYHRRSPIDHLYQLKSFLREGGELCLETLVIADAEGQLLVPPERYARMRNVWFIPSAAELLLWLRRTGFVNARVVDETDTAVDEQRSTDWMQFESLQQSLNKDNPALTVEGLPAPRRAVILANKP